MNRREKILLVAFSTVLGVVVLYGAVHSLILAPAARYAGEVDVLRKKQGELGRENLALTRAPGEYMSLRNRTFEGDPLKVSVQVTSRINDLARQAGLGQDDITTNAFTGRVVRDAYREIGCIITARGPLERMTNFLYLLSRDRCLHRLTNLSVTPQPRSRDVSFALRYSTLVLEDVKHPTISTRPASQPVAGPSLTSPDRQVYDVIALRNIFAPYVRRPPVVAVGPTPPPPGPGPQPPVSPPEPSREWYDRLVVTGLPSTAGEPEIHVTPPGQPIEKVLKVGDRLPVGKIEMVDYRVLPRPDRPSADSTSRLILKIGQAYWAVELGQSLGERRVLGPQELPEELRPAQAPAGSSTQPAET